jgi:peptidoglycan/LPS O-acetylase OafA/YrhL
MAYAQRRPLRLQELDALRGIAAIGVLIFHFTSHYGRLYGHRPPLQFAFDIGNYGVHLFFMISGFVIFMTLEQTSRATDFMVSRFSRLFPAFWAAMALTLIAVESAGLAGQKVPTQDAWINLSMLPDLFDAREVDGSYWTLQIELLFYMQMLGWYLLGGLKRVRIVICAWLLLAAMYGLAARWGQPLSYLARELLIVRFIPFFAAGILFYRMQQGRDPLLQNTVLVGLCAVAAGLVWGYEIALVLAACAGVFALLVAGKLKFLAQPVLLFFGGISYTVYLIHQNIGFIEISWLERLGVAPLLSVAIASATTILLAWLLSVTVERPALRAIRVGYARLGWERGSA